MSIAPTSTGYADVNGLHLYYEDPQRRGTPLVLLHGGVHDHRPHVRLALPTLTQRTG